MMKKIYNTLTLLVVASFFCLSIQAQEHYEKVYHKSFPVTAESELTIVNKYGKVNIMTWTKDSVRFRVDIEIEAKNISKLDKIVESLEIKTEKNGKYVRGTTNVTSGSIFKDISELLTKDDRINIDYNVYVPEGMRLKVDNKYGNIYLGRNVGKCDISLSHGNIKAGDIIKKSNIELSFGDLDIGEFRSGRLVLQSAELSLKRSTTLTIESRFSTLRIGEVSTLKINSRRDKLYLDKVGNVSGDGSYSKFWIKKLTGEFIMDFKFGDIEVDYIAKTFSTIIVDSRFTDIDFYFESPVGYSFDMTHRKVDFIYPKQNSSLDTKLFDNGKKDTYNTYGDIGQNTSGKRVKLNAENCTVKIVI